MIFSFVSFEQSLWVWLASDIAHGNNAFLQVTKSRIPSRSCSNLCSYSKLLIDIIKRIVRSIGRYLDEQCMETELNFYRDDSNRSIAILSMESTFPT